MQEFKQEIEDHMRVCESEIKELITSFPTRVSNQIQDSCNKYYKGLYAICDLLAQERPIVALDMGTYEGVSAIMMAAQGRVLVDTIDTDQTYVFDREVLDTYCRVKQVKPDYWKQIPYEFYDFIFVDLSHEGSIETSIHLSLLDKYSGYAFYDDIDINDGMKMFWASIKEEDKISVPNWHTVSPKSPALTPGFGIVKYNL
jgi:hypothetical protein